MRTPPGDLPEPALRAALASGWALRAATLAYRPVGFGSHHWDLTDDTGARWFVTVDDLRTRRRTAGEPLTAGYQRLRAALTAAQALRATGRDFVVAALPARGGEPVTPLGTSFAVAVHPYVTGESFDEDAHRRGVLDLLVAVHAAPPDVRGRARAEDYTIEARDALDGGGADLGPGPYARTAAALLTAHGPGVRAAAARYDDLVRGVRADPPRAVLTHGEPHPGNTIRAGGRWLLIDWDTALAAPPERDLWGLDLDAAYAAATGTAVRRDVLDLYRLRWDLTEIAVGLARFGRPHGATADDEETWSNLQESVARIA